jgi:hypothetical protein
MNANESVVRQNGNQAAAVMADYQASQTEIAMSNMLGYEPFSKTKAYVTSDIVIYEGKLYKFKANKAEGEWDATKVDETSIKAILATKANA